jgi:hypothetical protein
MTKTRQLMHQKDGGRARRGLLIIVVCNMAGALLIWLALRLI